MKKLFFGLVAMAGLLAATSCSQEDVALKSGEGRVSFNVGVNGDAITRAISDGSGANKLAYQVYQNNVAMGDIEVIDNVTDWPTSVEFQLNNGTYQVVFWAQNADCTAYTYADSDLANITVSYEGAQNNDETRDAFYLVKEIQVVAGQSNSYDIDLIRPFAQVNVGMTAEELSNNTISQSSMAVTGLNNAINLISGETTGDATTGQVMFALANVVTDDLTIGESEYEWLSMSYLLPGDNVNANFVFEGTQNYTLEMESVPVKANMRTNILGNVVTGDVTVNVDKDPKFAGDEDKEGQLVPEDGDDEGGNTVEVSDVKAEVVGDNVNFSASYTGEVTSAYFVCTPTPAAAALRTRAEDDLRFEATAQDGKLTATAKISEFDEGVTYNTTVEVNGVTVEATGEAPETITPNEGNGGTDEPAGPVEPVTVTWDFTTNDYGFTRDSGNGSNDAYIASGTQLTQDGVTITLYGDDGQGWRLWTDGLREYNKKNPYFTVTADGNEITEVSWTVISGATFKLDGTDNNITEWKGNSTELKFVGTASSNKAVKTITVTYTPSK